MNVPISLDSCWDVSLKNTALWWRWRKNKDDHQYQRGSSSEKHECLQSVYRCWTLLCTTPGKLIPHITTHGRGCRLLQLLWYKLCICVDSCLLSMPLYLHTIHYTVHCCGFLFSKAIIIIMLPLPDYLCCCKHWPRWLFTIMLLFFCIYCLFLRSPSH